MDHFLLWLAAIVAFVVNGILLWTDAVTLATGLAVTNFALAAAFAAGAWAARR